MLYPRRSMPGRSLRVARPDATRVGVGRELSWFDEQVQKEKLVERSKREYLSQNERALLGAMSYAGGAPKVSFTERRGAPMGQYFPEGDSIVLRPDRFYDDGTYLKTIHSAPQDSMEVMAHELGHALQARGGQIGSGVVEDPELYIQVDRWPTEPGYTGEYGYFGEPSPTSPVEIDADLLGVALRERMLGRPLAEGMWGKLDYGKAAPSLGRKDVIPVDMGLRANRFEEWYDAPGGLVSQLLSGRQTSGGYVAEIPMPRASGEVVPLMKLMEDARRKVGTLDFGNFKAGSGGSGRRGR